jgi:hypothetical protein
MLLYSAGAGGGDVRPRQLVAPVRLGRAARRQMRQPAFMGYGGKPCIRLLGGLVALRFGRQYLTDQRDGDPRDDDPRDRDT